MMKKTNIRALAFQLDLEQEKLLGLLLFFDRGGSSPVIFMNRCGDGNC